jgi:hypothetical protein
VHHPYVDFSKFPHCLLLQKSVRVIIPALIFLRNAGPYSSLETVLITPIQVMGITWLQPSGYQSKPGPAPTLPFLVDTPPPGKMQIGTSLGGSRTSASYSRSEAILLAVGGCGDHFWLYYESVRGQTAEILTREYRTCASPHGRPSRKQAGQAQLGHAQGGPVQGGFYF